MKIRNIAKQFETVYDFHIQNLIVGGCSFTFNNHETSACTWPYYLRDLGGFAQVYDFSMVGGGNQHTLNAMVYGLAEQVIDPAKSLVIVQIAGNDRDDYIVDPACIGDYPFTYNYAVEAMVAITGGEGTTNLTNSKPITDVKGLKNKTCRSIENFVNILSLKTYLDSLGYQSIFFEYRDYRLPGRDNNFDPRQYLPKPIADRYDSILDKLPKNFHQFCLYHDLMEKDDFHPSPDGHLRWTRESLVPYLINRYQ